MLRLIRYIKGYIFFFAEGGFPERFINLCNLKGIYLWNVKNDGVKVSAFTNINAASSLEYVAKQSGMEICIQKTVGLKSFINQHKWRCGAIMGIGFIVCFLAFMSGFIWEVEVVCENTVKAKSFTQELERYGIKKGVKKSEIDVQDIKRQLMESHRDYAWVSINVFGGKLRAEMRSADESMDIIYHDKPFNVVARKNGRVTLVKGYYGQNLVKAGDYVSEGSLLISGVSLYGDGTEHLFHAKGEVTAETETVLGVEAAKTLDCRVTDENQSRYYFYFFGAELPLGFRNRETYRGKNYIFLDSSGGVLPLGVVREDGFSSGKRTISFTEEQGRLISLLKYAKRKREEFVEDDKADFESISLVFREKSEKYLLDAKIKCVENIAVEKPIELE